MWPNSFEAHGGKLVGEVGDDDDDEGGVVSSIDVY